MISFKAKSDKYKLIAIIITLLVLCIGAFFSSMASGWTGLTLDDDDFLRFSKESGSYAEPFELTISYPYGTVYYTTDGSIPDTSSYRYEGGIHVYDPSSEPNRYSTNTDISTGFYEDKLSELGQKVPGYYSPEFPVDKAFVVRARAFVGDAPCSETRNATYFIGYDKKDGYDNVQFVSLLADPEDLFSEDKGIYVTGDTFAEYEKNGLEGTYSWWEANYRNRTIEWERHAVFQTFDDNGGLILSQKCGIRIHGAYSRTFPQKSFSLYARKVYDGNSRFAYPFFGNGAYYDKLVLASGGNDIHAKVKDYLVQEAMKESELLTQDMLAKAVFLNGEYWGMYYLTQKYDDESFFHDRYGIDVENVIVMKDNTLDTGLETDYPIYGEMKNYCTRTDLSVDDYYRKACTYIDIDSYIDYNAVMIYLARNGDWPSANVGLWRARKKQYGFDNEYGDGRWRWILFDLNSAGMSERFANLPLYEMAGQDEMFASFIKNEEFKARLEKRIVELSENEFEPAQMEKNIAAFKEKYKNALYNCDRRFYGDFEGRYVDDQLEDVKTFFYERKKYIDNTLLK